jgi:hypothetical protein
MTEIIKSIVRKENLKVKYLTDEKCHEAYLKTIFKVCKIILKIKRRRVLYSRTFLEKCASNLY